MFDEIRAKLIALSQDMNGCLRDRLEQIIAELDREIEDAQWEAQEAAERRDAFGD